MPEPDRYRQLAAEALAQGDPTGWFERLYREGATSVPWADQRPNPNLVSWWESEPAVTVKGAKALVVGCGLGDDAEYLASLGATVTAFDIAPTAIATARGRFPQSAVNYQVADLLNPPQAFHRQFDFVFEAYTLQALPADVRPLAIDSVTSFVAACGALLIVARGRDDDEPAGGIPWPLTLHELSQIDHRGLLRLTVEDYLDVSIRRLRVLYRRL